MDFSVSRSEVGGGGGGGLFRGRGTGLFGILPSGFRLSDDLVRVGLGLPTTFAGLVFFDSLVSCCSCSGGGEGGPESCLL